MKNFGIFCIGLGGLSLLGALMAGHNAFGPLFWLALGIALVIIAKQREDNKRQTSTTARPQTIEPSSKTTDNSAALSTNNTSSSHRGNTMTQPEIQTIISYDDVPLTWEQKEAAICLISFFAGYNDDVETNDVIYQLTSQAAKYLEIPNYPEMLPDAMRKNQEPNKMMNRVMTIMDRKSKECTLLVCYDLTKMSGKEEAYEILFNLAREMGYNRERFLSLVRQYSH